MDFCNSRIVDMLLQICQSLRRKGRHSPTCSYVRRWCWGQTAAHIAAGGGKVGRAIAPLVAGWARRTEEQARGVKKIETEAGVIRMGRFSPRPCCTSEVALGRCFVCATRSAKPAGRLERPREGKDWKRQSAAMLSLLVRPSSCGFGA